MLLKINGSGDLRVVSPGTLKPTRMKSFRSLLLCSLVLVSTARAQTTLFPGEVAIVGVNANNNCAPMPAQSDQFTIVLLKAITTNMRERPKSERPELGTPLTTATW